MKKTFLYLVFCCTAFKGFAQCPSGTSPGNNLITNGDFSNGNTGFYSTYTYCNTNDCLFPLGDNGYSIGSDPSFFHSSFGGKDHTTGTGNLMVVNGSDSSLIVWRETITVQPNTVYVFSAWICAVYPVNPAHVNFYVNGVKVGAIAAPSSLNLWLPFSVTWNSGSNTSATLSIKDNASNWTGTDYGLDDISFQPCACSAGNTGIVSALRDTICSGTPVVLSVAGTSSSLQWQSSSSLSGFTNISGMNTASCIEIPSQTTFYRVFSGNGNCADTSAPYKIIVKPSPVAAFSFASTGLALTFDSDSSSKDVTTHNWDFGDSTASTLPNPDHTFSRPDTFHVCLSVFNGSNCSFTICRDIKTDFVSGINSVTKESDWKVFPNPAGESFRTSSPHQLGTIKIYNSLGQLIYKNEISLEQNISTDNFPSGNYYITLQTDVTVKVKRLIIIH